MTTMPRSRSYDRGITIMDLLVTFVVVAILAALAVPSYREVSMRGQRAEAQRALSELAKRMEQRRETTGAYATTLAEIRFPPITSANGYTLSIDTGATTTTFFRLLATAREKQMGDTQCRTFILTSTGLRKAFNVSRSDTSHVCWRS